MYNVEYYLDKNIVGKSRSQNGVLSYLHRKLYGAVVRELEVVYWYN